MSVIEQFNAGDIEAAIAAATADVKAKPTAALPRVVLAEMLCFAGDLERADTILDAAVTVEPSSGVAVSQFRHLLHAEAARRDFYSRGRMPEFLNEPDAQAKLRLGAALLLREGDTAGAAKQLAEAEASRPAVTGSHGGEAFSDFRDGDDLLGPYLEVLSPDGRYFWMASWEIKSLSFEKPTRPLDQMFREAAIVTASAEGAVFIPVLYAGVQTQDPELSLGRATDWVGDEGEPVRGVGQRAFFAGIREIAVMELDTLTFDDGGAA